jgi:hypothetical protein
MIIGTKQNTQHTIGNVYVPSVDKYHTISFQIYDDDVTVLDELVVYWNDATASG